VEVQLGSARGRRSLVRESCLAHFAGRDEQAFLQGLSRLVAAAQKGSAAPKRGERAQSADEQEDAHVHTGKTLGRKPVNRLVEKKGRSEVAKTLGRKPAARAPANTLARKTLGRAAHLAGEDEAAQLLSRALVRQKIAERLSGRLSPAGLATWARTHWLEVQRGAPAESGQRELLEDTLQRLTLSTLPASKLSDEQLIELMTQLDT
jgi:3-dehydroquinate dehydratase-2